MRCILALFGLALLINGSLADSILLTPCDTTNPDAGFLYPGDCAVSLFDVGWQYIQCSAEYITMYVCQDPFCTQCKIAQQLPASAPCDVTSGSMQCITGHVDYSKYFGTDYVLTGVFGVAKLLGQQNATCTDSLDWVRVYKPNKCTVQASLSGFSGSQMTSCENGVVRSRSYTTSDCSGTPVLDSAVDQNTCDTSEDGYIEMSTCYSN